MDPECIHVCLIEDDRGDYLLTRKMLSRIEGRAYELDWVSTFEEGQEAIRQCSYDVYLVDFRLGEHDGLELMREAVLHGCGAPLILLTGQGDIETDRAAMEAGAADYLVKGSIDAFSLERSIRYAIERKRSERALLEAHEDLERRVQERTRALAQANEALKAEIAEREQTQEALRVSEERFRTALKAAPITMFQQDRDLRLTWVHNPASGYSADELIGKTDADLIDNPEDLAAVLEIKRRVLETGIGERREIRVRARGLDRYFDITAEPLCDPQGRVVGITCATMDITDRKRVEETLRRQAEDLAEAARNKDEFLAMLGHELRNPLGAISNAIELLRLRDPQPVGAMANIRAILDRQVANMTRLVNELLDVSRITRGKIELRKAPVEFAEIVGHAVAAVQPLMAEAHHNLTVNLPGEPMVLEADPTRLEQIASNLLHNAAKYTPRGGEIEVTLRREGDEAILSVKDNGLGLSPEILPHVFDLFTQAHGALDRSRGGLGLGLTLVRRLVELHGGRVEARSEGPGRGSEFIIRLPMAGFGTEGSGIRDSGFGTEGFGSDPAPNPGSRIPNPESLRVLIVDDNTDAAEALVDIVSTWGHTASTVDTGAAALEAAQSGPWDLVILDIGLPDLDGYEVARRLHTNGDALPFTLVALTGYGQEEDRRRAREAGFHHHLTKPVDLAALQKLLAKSGHSPD